MNSATLIGTITSEVRRIEIRDGVSVTKFRMKTVEQFHPNGELVERSQTHLIDVWNPYLQKEITPFLREGQFIGLRGSIESRNMAKKGEPAAWTTTIVVRGGGEICVYGGPGSNLAVRGDAASNGEPKIDHSDRKPASLNEFEDDSLDVPF